MAIFSFPPGKERKFPFAAIVTHDNSYDNFSKLDSSGFYRLSAGVSPETFKTAISQDSTDNFLARDVITPNPVYGKMHWLSVPSPQETTVNTFLTFVSESYDLQTARSKKRQAIGNR